MRYDFAPLEELARYRVRPELGGNGQMVGSSVRALAGLLGVDPKQVYRWRKIGVTVDQADTLAVRLGLHPVEVWPEWMEDATRTCAAKGCGEVFVPAAHARGDQRWCSTLCRKREWAREQYHKNPEYAAAERARSNAYWAEWRAPFRHQSTRGLRYTSGEKTVVPASRQRPGTVADPSREGADNGRP